MPMSKTRHPHGPCLLPPACEKDCDDVPRELPHYFTGRVLTARDLRDEQGYVLSRLRLRNRLFHGWGVVCGLDVCSHPDPACRDQIGRHTSELQSLMRISYAVFCLKKKKQKKINIK